VLAAVGAVYFFASMTKDGAGDDGAAKVAKADGAAQPFNNVKPDFEIPKNPLPGAIAPEVTQRVKRSTAKLQVTLANGSKKVGSGFFAIERGLVVSNAHVVGMLYLQERPRSIDVVVNSGEPDEFSRAAKIIGVDRDDDLALLRLEG